MLINVLFLGVVDPHERVDRFDDALSIPDEIPIDLSGRKAAGEPSKEPRQVDDLPVCSAHRPQSVTIDQKFGDLRVDGAFVLAFVLDDVFDEPVRLQNQLRRMI